MSSNNNMRITDIVTVILLVVLIVLNIFNSVHVGKVKFQMASLLGPGGENPRHIIPGKPNPRHIIPGEPTPPGNNNKN